MAVVAKEMKIKSPKATVVIRFLGTTSDSGSARNTLYSVCRQIVRVYGGNEQDVPLSYKELITYFR